MKNLTITQKIAMKWLTIIDSNQAFFLLLKPLHVSLRAIFYTLLIAGTFVILNVALSFVELTRELSLLIALIPTSGVSFIIFYEAIFSLNIQEILKARKEKEQFIKTNKIEKWRLRNMSFWVRIILYLILYLILYIILQQFLQIASMVAFLESVTAPTQTQISEFINEFQTLLKYSTVAYVLILLSLEYFINQRKVKQCSSQS